MGVSPRTDHPAGDTVSDMVESTAAARGREQGALHGMAAAFLREWRRRARPGHSPCAALQGSVLLLRLEGALTPAEVELSRRPAGIAAVRRALATQLDHLYPWLAHEVEAHLHCFVAESDLAVDFDAQAITCRLILRDLPRPFWPAQDLADCADTGPRP